MTDDASTAYICIYCPFNSDNLQALEHHLTSAHGHGCQDSPQSSSNIAFKAKKRDAPDDEQSRSSLDGTEQISESKLGVKRIKRTSSPMSAHLVIHSSDDYSESEDDERDSSANLPVLSCPVCGSTFDRPSHLARHAQRKHHIDLSNPIADIERSDSIDQQTDMPSFSSSITENETSVNASTTTECPYCDFKTTDIELFKGHIIAHIRDKNYRCLLCNRLYKYRGDCSFHIRRKHHRYSVNSNDYIQRFLFDTTEGDDSLSTQAGGQSLSGNVSASHANSTRESDEPLRYFGCPYCDYTSNYGGDVRKHQARKHPNAESKVVKIIRQDSGQPNLYSNFDEVDEDDSHHLTSTTSNKSGTTKVDKSLLPPASLPMLSNFAPVRVFQCSSCHQQGTYKWVVERHIRAKHTDQADAHVIELPAELSVKLQKITPPLKRFRCSLCPLQSKHSWVVIRHIKHFHTLQTASVIDIQPNGKPISDEPLAFQNGDFTTKSDNHDSESTSSMSSSCMENGVELEDDRSPSSSKNESTAFLYKCSSCHYQSHVSWNIQKHINENHVDQPNVYMLTECRQKKISSNEPAGHSGKKSKHKNGFNRSLSPTSALVKAKFSPAVEEALLSIQGSKLNPILYAVQPKFGIKRLKCRHCFYRSNWKTDMIRHVRIRHNLTEPDHNKDMISMTEQEARSTIELYENTFGKELRRRTFRTWNDWAKAEQEFTPKDGSLQYANPNNGQTSSEPILKKTSSSTGVKTSNHNEIKRVNRTNIKSESSPELQPKNKPILFNPLPTVQKEEYKQLPNPSNIVSRLLLTTSPSSNTDDDTPLDLSLKPSSSEETSHSDEQNNEHSSLIYRCSACPYTHSNWSTIQRHVTYHLTGQGLLCPLCSYITDSQNSILRHMTINHPTSQITTKFLSSSPISTAYVLEQHQCSLCSFHCDRSEALNLHRRLEHDEEEFDIDSSEDEDDINASTTKHLFDCPLCSPSPNANIYSNLEQFTMHAITHQNNEACPFCSFVAHPTSSHTLTEHIKLHFNGTLVQPESIVGVEQVKELLMLE